VAHRGQHQLDHRDEAEDVGLELTADLGHRGFFERTLQTVAGVVDHDADRALGAHDRFHGSAHRRFIAHVKR
jgi:hypothetical protein